MKKYPRWSSPQVPLPDNATGESSDDRDKRNLRGFWSHFSVKSRSKRLFRNVPSSFFACLAWKSNGGRCSCQFPSVATAPRSDLSPFECKAAIILCRFARYFLSQSAKTVLNRTRAYVPTYIYISLTYLLERRTRISVARPFTPNRKRGGYRGGGIRSVVVVAYPLDSQTSSKS